MALDAAGFRPARDVAGVAVRAAGRRRPRRGGGRSTRWPSSPRPRLPRPGSPGISAPRRSRPAIAEAGGEPVGTGYALRSDGDAGPCLYLAGVAVLPSARGRGIGSLLTSWLLARGFAAGAELAHLHPDTDAAARLYARFGFAEVDGLDVYVDL